MKLPNVGWQIKTISGQLKKFVKPGIMYEWYCIGYVDGIKGEGLMLATDTAFRGLPEFVAGMFIEMHKLGWQHSHGYDMVDDKLVKGEVIPQWTHERFRAGYDKALPNALKKQFGYLPTGKLNKLIKSLSFK
jgi:hypothetical protein